MKGGDGGGDGDGIGRVGGGSDGDYEGRRNLLYLLSSCRLAEITQYHGGRDRDCRLFHLKRQPFCIINLSSHTLSSISSSSHTLSLFNTQPAFSHYYFFSFSSLTLVD